jgi:uncharacterized membrane protein YedE/YeeE
MLQAFQDISYDTVLLGGALIGISSVLLLAFNGRIAGICGMAFSLMATSLDKNIWRLVFLVGLVVGSLLYHFISGASYPPAPNTSLPLLIVGGLLVGYGTSLGNGCTSGHGISGIARLSPRSIVATLTFMASAIATLYILKHILGAAI